MSRKAPRPGRRRLRVAIVAPSLAILGGQGVQAHILIEHLRADGFQVDLLPINPVFPPALSGLRQVPYLRTVLNEAIYIPRLSAVRRADVVHVFSASYWSFLLAPVPALIAARLAGRPVVLHYHSGEADDHLTHWGPLVHPWLRLVDEIVVPSVYLQEVFAKHGYPSRVIRNALDVSAFPYRERIALQPRLLSVRNLEQMYGVDQTLRAFAYVKAKWPHATLTIAGYGSEERRLRDLAATLRLDGVRFVGRVEPAKLPRLYDEADIFLNSSTIDNQPVSILEALACGLPIVSTPIGDIPAMLRHGHAGILVPPGDPEAMAAAVDTLLTHPGRVRAVTRAGIDEVERYNWMNVRDDWTTLYHAMATSAARLAVAAPVPVANAAACTTPRNPGMESTDRG
ncbi:MAG TPA: glycosyltransferase family 4 protein [Vicinamibacterales bacterium]